VIAAGCKKCRFHFETDIWGILNDMLDIICDILKDMLYRPKCKNAYLWIDYGKVSTSQRAGRVVVFFCVEFPTFLATEFCSFGPNKRK